MGGYKCAVMDGLERGEVCEPNLIEYEEIDYLNMQNNLYDECFNNNFGFENQACAIDACVIEAHFVNTVTNFLFNQVTPDQTLNHNSGNFEPTEHCQVSDGYQVKSERQCCGQVPTRYPFKTFDGNRACCGEKTYATGNLQCRNGDTGNA